MTSGTNPNEEKEVENGDTANSASTVSSKQTSQSNNNDDDDDVSTDDDGHGRGVPPVPDKK